MSKISCICHFPRWNMHTMISWISENDLSRVFPVGENFWGWRIKGLCNKRTLKAASLFSWACLYLRYAEANFEINSVLWILYDYRSPHFASTSLFWNPLKDDIEAVTSSFCYSKLCFWLLSFFLFNNCQH